MPSIHAEGPQQHRRRLETAKRCRWPIPHRVAQSQCLNVRRPRRCGVSGAASVSVVLSRPALTEGAGDMGKRRSVVTVFLVAAAMAASTIQGASQAIAGEKIGDCEILFDYPHKSGHAAGNITADQRIKCNTPQKYLGAQSYLYRSSANGGYRWLVEGKPGKGENVNYINSVAAEPCQNATYQSKANFLVIDNGGVRHERFDVWSPLIPITCG